MGAPVVHFEINTNDSKRVQDFYATLFEWKINANNPMNYGLVDTGVKMGINGGIGPKMDQRLPTVTFYAEVTDPQACLDKAVSLGAQVLMPVTEIPNMVTYALFSDPAGNAIGIIKGPGTPPKAAAARKTRKKAARAPKKRASGRKRGRR